MFIINHVHINIINISTNYNGKYWRLSSLVYAQSKIEFFVCHSFLFCTDLSNKLVLILDLLFFLLFFLFATHQLIEYFWIVVVYILVNSSLQSLHQLFFYLLLDIGSNQSLGLSYSISFFSFFLYRHQFFFTLKLQLSHLDQHLPQLCQSLLAFVNDKRWPIDKLLVNLLQCLRIWLIQFKLLPQLIW